jgi:hypothetical protein
MTSAPPSGPNGNGGHTTVVQAAIKLGGQAAHTLGPQFLALIIVNGLALGFLFWFVDARARHTADVLNRLLSACLTKQ